MAAMELGVGASTLEPVGFEELAGFDARGLYDAWLAFRRSCSAIARGLQPLRPARATPDAWRSFFCAVADGPSPRTDGQAEQFFRERFRPFRIHAEERAFFTGYYEPETQGALEPNPKFPEPILGRPPDLESFPPGFFPLGGKLSAGRRLADGSLAPFPTRQQIEEEGLELGRPIAWLRDGVEAFKIHVQGSARIGLPDGASVRLTYAGRNGRPYSSIGRILVREGQVPESDMSPDRIYAWLRAKGLGSGEPGRLMMQRNESYIFFELNSALNPDDGPIGAASVPLMPLRSIAIDREIWPYGLPYWIAGDWLSARRLPFRRLVIGQDTGSAIVGSARADIFFGSGDDAGRAAGDIRHRGEMFVLLPRLTSEPGT
jgi:membrane-bound lytic murein transglycosylase A